MDFGSHIVLIPNTNTMHSKEIAELVATQASNALKDLLSNKHLYQSVAIDMSFLNSWAINQHAEIRKAALRPVGPSMVVPSAADIKSHIEPYNFLPWYILKPNEPPMPMASLIRGDLEPPKIRLPTIRTYCVNQGCEIHGPCNPLSAIVNSHENSSQSFYFRYECQNCKGEPINFLVRRSRNKLTLCGRDPMEQISVSSCLPKDKDTIRHYRNAVIAFNAGQTLAAICLLRIFVEQFWRSIPLVSEKGRFAELSG